jgi:FlaA1/EpsC-like NDP-sugar epimerase
MKMKNNFLKIPINRIIALLIMDTMSIIIASFAALYIRFDFQFNAIPKEYMLKFEHVLPFNIAFTLLFFVIWKLYKSVWRYASATEMLNIVFATCCASAAQLVFCHLSNQKMPRSYYIIYLFLLFAMTCGIRFSYRILRIINMKRADITQKKNGNNVMLIGAGIIKSW